MKKLIIPFVLLLVLVVGACGKSETTPKEDNATPAESEAATFTYESETGPVEVPTNPKRVVMLSGFTGNVIQLGVPVVGADIWSKDNPTFEKEMQDVEEVSDEDLEKIIELDPDLIIGLSTIKNGDKLQAIAPTVTYTWGKLDYLNQHIEIGKLLNKEEEAKAWVEDFTKRVEEAGDEIRAEIGEDATVSVLETYGKDIYVFGDNWARGTEILYQGMGLKMPEKVKEMALESGYFALSAEVIPEYAGDYIVLSKYSDADNSFQETQTYQNIPAVKNGHLFEMKGEGASFSDPVTLEKQLQFFKDSFLGK
ncbi:iron-hydroxamate ABC transporter substrate-binding protein [Sporosarcina oncorhynchi]|uniref:Iron-hydroxamate ABC transporter substrate-binding protein n=1 Tax=Sporosarcina oncorhynchi TaxID=3056444 RepID=A0ABZ0L335_9BACL|nr:iron-hydroxamate ABC transporter substrate-binding protein [Sporosarcina sp. T2O-4]WOV86941.1 iron-hydroxamate ABC transporter substrate-binding protein [Sporosarcina sp. T2O-4]